MRWDMKRTAADFALLYPPYDWIPASVGMTERGVRLRRTGVWGVPQFLIHPPRSKIRLRRSGGQGVDGRQCARMAEALWDGPVSPIQQACPNGQQIEVDNQPNNP